MTIHLLIGCHYLKNHSMKDKYKLYAISTGNRIKIVLSKRIDKTFDSMLKGYEGHLEVLLTYHVGSDPKAAKREHKRLLKFCRKYFLEKDWFDMAVMDKIKEFRVK